MDACKVEAKGWKGGDAQSSSTMTESSLGRLDDSPGAASPSPSSSESPSSIVVPDARAGFARLRFEPAAAVGVDEEEDAEAEATAAEREEEEAEDGGAERSVDLDFGREEGAAAGAGGDGFGGETGSGAASIAKLSSETVSSRWMTRAARDVPLDPLASGRVVHGLVMHERLRDGGHERVLWAQEKASDQMFRKKTRTERGALGFGSVRRELRLRTTLRMLRAGDHWCLRMSRQMAPESAMLQ